MSNETEKEELFELSKDQNYATETIFGDLEDRLTRYKGTKPPLNLNSKIHTRVKLINTSSWPQKILLAVALVCISIAVLLIAKDTLKEKSNEGIYSADNSAYTQSTTEQNFNLSQNLGIELPEQHKYYALYLSSTLCKPCVELLSELDKFYLEQKSKNPNFEIVYIELHKHNYAANKNPDIHFKKIEFDAVKNKEIINKYREGHGPSFVVLDEKGNVVTKHKKNVHKNNFSTVLNQFSLILSKS